MDMPKKPVNDANAAMPLKLSGRIISGAANTHTVPPTRETSTGSAYLRARSIVMPATARGTHKEHTHTHRERENEGNNEENSRTRYM